uniref:Piwi domain-containing protein n=1 Tax=Panagrolaimus sp. PS1159 TaxID=55785 RepID=A0AC35EUX6_9BILA
MYSVHPPPISRHEPQPVPPSSTELIILGNEPSKLNASNLSNTSAIDANSFLPGTAKLTNYEIISNEANLPLSDIQAFTHVICYTHQIVASAVSLPNEPVFVAHELAKHGRNNLVGFCNVADVPRNDEGIDFAKLNKKLTYRINFLLNYC